MSSTNPPVISCAKDGPYVVKNLNTFSAQDGEEIPAKATMALCRCGASKNKPFCDGAHKPAGFEAE